MLEFDNKALKYNPIFGIVSIFLLLTMLISVMIFSIGLWDEPIAYLVINLLITIPVGFVLLYQTAHFIEYHDVSSTLNTEETDELQAVMKAYPEVNDYISAKVKTGQQVTKRDYYYLSTKDLVLSLFKVEARDLIKQFSEINKNSNAPVDPRLNSIPITDPLTIEMDENQAKDKKSRAIRFFLFYLIITSICSIAYLTIEDFSLRFALFPLIVLMFFLLFLMVVNIFSEKKKLIDKYMLQKDMYAKIRDMASYDRNVVYYLRQVADQNRILYHEDCKAMQLDKRFEILNNLKITNFSILNNAKP